jgi:hypothetical protein
MVNQYNVLIPDGQIKSAGHYNQPTGFVSSWAIEVRKEKPWPASVSSPSVVCMSGLHLCLLE